MTEELKPIDVSKYTVTESGNVIRTDNTETLKNALERIYELEKEKCELLGIIQEKDKVIAKAKGMIKTFVDYEKANAIILNYNEFLKQAEDFIKE